MKRKKPVVPVQVTSEAGRSDDPELVARGSTQGAGAAVTRARENRPPMRDSVPPFLFACEKCRDPHILFVRLTNGEIWCPGCVMRWKPDIAAKRAPFD